MQFVVLNFMINFPNVLTSILNFIFLPLICKAIESDRGRYEKITFNSGLSIHQFKIWKLKLLCLSRNIVWTWQNVTYILPKLFYVLFR